ncbi:MAG: phosphoglycerate mutase family protein [Pseudomonadota bacterium]
MHISSFWFIRHGKSIMSEYDKDPGIVQEGVLQCNNLKKSISNNAFTSSKIYCSTKKRARETCEIIFSNQQVEYLDVIAELDRREYYDFKYNNINQKIINHEKKLSQWLFDLQYDNCILVAHGGIFYLILKILKIEYVLPYIDYAKLMHFKYLDGRWIVLQTSV